jgi:hypothetical protein
MHDSKRLAEIGRRASGGAVNAVVVNSQAFNAKGRNMEPP